VVRSHPDTGEVVRQTLRDLLPSIAASLTSPGDDAPSAAVGISDDALRTFALAGLTRRLDIIGVPISIS